MRTIALALAFWFGASGVTAALAAVVLSGARLSAAREAEHREQAGHPAGREHLALGTAADHPVSDDTLTGTAPRSATVVSADD